MSQDCLEQARRIIIDQGGFSHQAALQGTLLTQSVQLKIWDDSKVPKGFVPLHPHEYQNMLQKHTITSSKNSPFVDILIHHY